MYTVRRYLTKDGRDIVGEWLASLRDIKARARILARIDRVASDNFGDCKLLRDGISELRIDHGPGYRLYFSVIGMQVVLLLCGGDKRTQASDIKKAIAFLSDFKERSL